MADDLASHFEALAAGDPVALEHIVQALYDELRELARHRLRDERAGHTLQATALVNEAYLRLARERHLAADSRTRFLAIASNMMRRVLVDYARARQRAKRGGNPERVPLESVEAFLSDVEAEEILALEGCARAPGARQSARRPRCRAALLRRPGGRGDCGPARSIGENRAAGLGGGPRLGAEGSRPGAGPTGLISPCRAA